MKGLLLFIGESFRLGGQNTRNRGDSYKDLNPLYYIVNREQSNVFHSEGHVFDKNNFE
jgi:hypothetical protein